MPYGRTVGIVNFSLQSLVQLGADRLRTEINLFPAIPQPPAYVKATALIQAIRIEWPEVEGVDGYQVAAMPSTELNLASPQKLYTVSGGQQLGYVEYVGDVATARGYSVQSFKRSVSGETLYSEWAYPVVTATSKAVGGAADAAPPDPPSAPITPPVVGDSGDPGGVVPTGGDGPVSE